MLSLNTELKNQYVPQNAHINLIHEELMLVNCGVGEDSWESLGHGRKQTSPSSRKSAWIFIGRTDAEAEALILWPPDAKSWLIRKDPDAEKDWRQEDKGMTEDEMVGWHHRFNRHEWANSRRLWRTGKPGVLESMGSQRVRHDWATEHHSLQSLFMWPDPRRKNWFTITSPVSLERECPKDNS